MRPIEFKEHRIWECIASISNSLDGNAKLNSPNRHHPEIKKKIDYLYWVLQESDEAYYSEQDLEVIARDLEVIVREIDQDPDLKSSYDRITNILSAILARNSYPRQKKIYKSESLSIIKSLSESAAVVDASVFAIQIELNKIRDDLQGSKVRHDNILANQEIELSKLHQRLLEWFSAWELKYNTQANNTLATFEERFAAFQNERTKEFTNAFERVGIEIADIKMKLLEVKSISDEQSLEFPQKFKTLLSQQEAEGRHTLDMMIGLYQQAGQIALSGGFVEAAIEEKSLYKANASQAKWAFGLTTTILALGWAFMLLDGQHDVKDLLLRLPISIVFLIPGLYFSNLAAQHRRTSINLQSLGLRIKAFDSYLTSADVNQQQKLRDELAGVFFSGFESQDFRSKVSVGFLGDVFSRFFGLSEKIVDKAVDKIVQRHL